MKFKRDFTWGFDRVDGADPGSDHSLYFVYHVGDARVDALDIQRIEDEILLCGFSFSNKEIIKFISTYSYPALLRLLEPAIYTKKYVIRAKDRSC